MTGMDAVIQTRSAGLKPAAVFVHLVDKPSRAAGYLGDGNFVVEVGPTEHPDFRPLIGLHVVVFDNAGDSTRHRAVTKAISQAKPGLLQMAIRDGEAWVVHGLKAGQTVTERYTGEQAQAIEGAFRV